MAKFDEYKVVIWLLDRLEGEGIISSEIASKAKEKMFMESIPYEQRRKAA